MSSMSLLPLAVAFLSLFQTPSDRVFFNAEDAKIAEETRRVILRLFAFFASVCGFMFWLSAEA